MGVPISPCLRRVAEARKGIGVGAVRAGPKVTVILGIEHVQLAMPAGREADARRFYSGLLGIPEVAKPPALAKRGGAWFESGTVKIHLGVEGDFRPARKAHPALLVRGLRAMIERLREAQAAVVGPSRGLPSGVRR